ncbi:TonB-dependent receptor plug domain-containing protein [Opitutia bacterium ISCC 51]|nr:TonB-dependent receptor plug domain-containing protein [Opitutae bacterium ISCC 51]QXD29670.1 TonB-dependent receptor plug domain-containing protein [Opitutae bacterium ISCC 52]
MKAIHPKDYIRILFVLVLSCAVISQPLLAQNEDEEDVYTLSQFQIDESEVQGYLATSTLAGTRIKTDLKDLGSAISVVTEEFMDDVSATDAQTLLSYTLGTEVGGYQGNFAGGSEQRQSRIYLTDERVNPQRNQRIRGLGSADLTRGFFLSDIPFDTYNTERVTVSRGPNSLLFGIGSPGGVINNATKQALHGEEFGEIGVRLDNYGSWRLSFDYNKPLIEDKLSLRVAMLEESMEFKQQPAYEDQSRIYAALDWIIAEGNGNLTRFRVNYEDGEQEGSPLEVIPPTVAYHNWFEPISSNISQYTGVEADPWVISPSEGGTWQFQALHDNPLVTQNDESKVFTNVHPTIFRHVGISYTTRGATVPDVGGGLGLGGYNGLIPWSPSRDTLASTGLVGTPVAQGLPDDTPVGGFRDWHTVSPYAEGYATGFVAPTLQNRDVFDFYNHMYSNGLDNVVREFDALNIALEQSFFDGKAGIEVAFDEQSYFTHENFPFSGGNGTSSAGPYDIYVHNSVYLTNGQLNPNLGRAYTRVRAPQQFYNWSDRETFRITAFGEVDLSENDGFLGWLGRHRWTGLYNDYSLDTFMRNTKDQGDSNEIDMNSTQQAGSQGLRHGRRNVNIMAYTSEQSLIGVQSMDDVRLHPIDFVMYEPGLSYNYAWVDTTGAGDRMIHTNEVFINRMLFNENINQTNIEAKALAWQGYFLDDTIVAMYGYREDDTESFARNPASEASASQYTSIGEYNPEFTKLSSTPALVEDGDTQTWSVVGRLPENLLGEMPFDFQVHWATSENFNPIGLRNNALGETIGQPTGTTEEYGFQFSSKDNRYVIKLNWFETQLANVNAGVNFNLANHVFNRINEHRDGEQSGIDWNEHLIRLPGGADPAGHPIQTYDQWYSATLNSIPSVLRDIVSPQQVDNDGDGMWDEYQFDSIPNLRSTRDQKAEGFEIEFVANPTASWRLMANIGQQETVFSNTAPVMAQLTQEYVAAIEASRMDELQEDGAFQRDEETYSINLGRGIRGPIVQARALDGTVSNEQREWRFTGVSTYQFREGALEGWGVGGAVRWEDEAATGYVFSVDPETGAPLPDVNRPYYDDGLFSGDLWFTYNTMIWDDKVDWRLQLNIRNLVGESGNIPVRTNPDGQVAVIRIPNPRTVYLSSTFKF